MVVSVIGAQIHGLLARTDWRHLLMVAGFGESTTAHLTWLEEAMRTGAME